MVSSAASPFFDTALAMRRGTLPAITGHPCTRDSSIIGR
jgi:hypothetical protein